MKYMGSKRRVWPLLAPIILKNRKKDQWYIEPFCGGCNSIDKVPGGKRIANDLNYYVVEMFKRLVYSNWLPPSEITEAEYKAIRDNKSAYDSALVGFVGICCSFGAKWFRGYARCAEQSNYALCGQKNLLKQKPFLDGVIFQSMEYQNLTIPDGSIVYCDPPYTGTTNYGKRLTFNAEYFWQWVRKISQNNFVFVSEYSAPSDFECLIEIKNPCTMNNQKTKGAPKITERTEKLFKWKEVF